MLAVVKRCCACKENHCFHQASSRRQGWSVRDILQLMVACKACSHLTAHSFKENMFRVLSTYTEMASDSVMSNRMPLAPKLRVSVTLLKCLQAGLHNFHTEFPQMGVPQANVVIEILSGIICVLGEIFENDKCSSSTFERCGLFISQKLYGSFKTVCLHF